MLPPLIISKTKCYLQLERSVPISKFLEATLRGTMGYALKRNLCIFKNRECPNCLMRETCNYSRFFEPAPPQSSALQHNMQQSVRSWMFNAIQFNDKIQLEITLIGESQNFLESIIAALASAGNIGLGKNGIPYKVIEIFPARQYNLSEVPEQQATKAFLSFATPVTLRTQGKYMREWDTRLFFTTLLRRITNLFAIHNFPEPDFNIKELLEQAEKIKATAFLVPVVQDRTSTHQNRTINYGGLVGDVLLEGITPNLATILQVGELLSVGKNTVFGYGKFSIDWQN